MIVDQEKKPRKLALTRGLEHTACLESAFTVVAKGDGVKPTAKPLPLAEGPKHKPDRHGIDRGPPIC